MAIIEFSSHFPANFQAFNQSLNQYTGFNMLMPAWNKDQILAMVNPDTILLQIKAPKVESKKENYIELVFAYYQQKIFPQTIIFRIEIKAFCYQYLECFCSMLSYAICEHATEKNQAAFASEYLTRHYNSWKHSYGTYRDITYFTLYKGFLQLVLEHNKQEIIDLQQGKESTLQHTIYDI